MFKALSEYADFGGPSSLVISTRAAGQTNLTNGSTGHHPNALPAVQIALHIHLPENKTPRDYESIIQDIAKYIYGRSEESRAEGL